MATSDEIAPVTRSCQEAIKETFKHVLDNPELHDWLEVQAASLNLWINALGVYARQELSIARRLSNNKLIATTVVQLLKAFRGNFSLLQDAILKRKPVAIAVQYDDGSSSDSSSSAASAAFEDIVDRQQSRIQDNLRHLTNIAMKLRREGTERAAARAAAYQPLGDDGEPLEDEFRCLIDTTLQRAFDTSQDARHGDAALVTPKSDPVDTDLGAPQYRLPEYLRQRLRTTMLDRWRRIAYQQHHSAGLAEVAEPPVVTLEEDIDLRDVLQIEADTTVTTIKTQAPIAEGEEETSWSRAPKTTATETPADFVLPKESELLPKAPGTVASSLRAGRLSYPSKPKVRTDTEVFPCTFCGQLQSTELLKRGKWEKHVMQDLQPYICVFEDCSKPYQSYQTTEKWLQHFEDAHAQDGWLCDKCPGGTFDIFLTPESYTQHLNEHHADGDLTAGETVVLIDFGRQRIRPKLPYCVFCGFEPDEDYLTEDESQRRIIDHMDKQHMRVFALDSMPWDIPGAAEDSAYRITHQSKTDSIDARSIIMGDEDLTLEYDQLDEEEKDKLANDPSLQRLLQSGSSNFEQIKSYTKMSFDNKSPDQRLFDKMQMWHSADHSDSEAVQSIAPAHRNIQEKNKDAESLAHVRYDDIIDWISPSNQSSIHESSRAQCEPGTTNWILETDVYEAWKAGSIRHIWLYGGPGCGKTIMCSSIVEDIREYCKIVLNVGQAMFYFSFRNTSKQSMDSVIGSVAIQLGMKEPGLSILYDAYQSSGQTPPTNDLLAQVSQAVANSYDEVFFHVDGLDECSSSGDDEHYLLHDLERWLEGIPQIRLIITSRNEVRVRQFVQNISAVPLEMRYNQLDVDIQTYVSLRLKESPTLSRLSPSTKSVIQKTLVQKSDGMFRWVDIQLQELERSRSLDERRVLNLLAESPRTLDEVYERLLDDIPYPQRSAALELLGFISFAQSPLSFEELMEVLDMDIRSNMKSLQPLGWRDILQSVSRLVTVRRDKDSDTEANSQTGPQDLYPVGSTVRLSHLSVHEFLISERIATKWFHLDPVREHAHITEACLAYLTYYSDFYRKGETRKLSFAFNFLDYASRNWYLHARLKENKVDISREVEFLTSERYLHEWLALHEPDESGPSPSREYNREEVGTCLYYACACGLPDVARSLLEAGHDPNLQKGRCKVPLEIAALNNYIEVMTVLLDHGANPDAPGSLYGSAINAASLRGNVEAAELLIKKGVDIHSPSRSHHAVYQTSTARPLRFAASNGHIEVVRLLIDHGADVNGRDEDGHGTALEAAMQRRHFEVAAFLLKTGAVGSEETHNKMDMMRSDSSRRQTP